MTNNIRKQQFDLRVSEVQEFSLVLYAFLYKANISWTDDVPTAAVTTNGGRATFFFNPEFWDKLTTEEQLFLLLHECYHIFLFHFTRFLRFDYITNAALDVAVNHSILRQYSFTDEQLPRLRVNGCWNDTVLDDQVLLDSLSAEEYLWILQQNAPKVKYFSMDTHGAMPGGTMEEIKRQIEQDLKDLFPEKTDQEIKDLLSDFEKQTGPIAGMGYSNTSVDAEWFKKKKKTWTKFARRLQKDIFDVKEQSVWLPNKRLRHLEREGMFIPTRREEEHFEKVNVVLLLDTSSSCSTYKKHFLGFAKALPKEYFDVHAFGFTTQPYKIDLKRPTVKSGGTSFHFFQRVFDSVPGKKIAFVFTDGHGSQCTLDRPELWHWFMYSRGSTSRCIPPQCRTHKLEEFE